MRRFILAALLLLPSVAHGQQPAVPEIVIAGLDAYRDGTATAALDIWFKGWHDEEIAVARPQLLKSFGQLDARAGDMGGYDILGFTPWGAHTGRIYVVMLYDTQPVYARFDVYLAKSAWKVMNITLNTDPAEILPYDLFSLPPAVRSASR